MMDIIEKLEHAAFVSKLVREGKVVYLPTEQHKQRMKKLMAEMDANVMRELPPPDSSN